MSGVPIATCATAYDDPVEGTTVILIFNKALYFGQSMDHSLVNPNQLRMHGIGVWDNPRNTHHDMGIDVESSDGFVQQHMPFHSQGSTV